VFFSLFLLVRSPPGLRINLFLQPKSTEKLIVLEEQNSHESLVLQEIRCSVRINYELQKMITLAQRVIIFLIQP